MFEYWLQFCQINSFLNILCDDLFRAIKTANK